MTWQSVYQRSLGDLLAAEKTRRKAVESDRVRLVELLTRLAQHHDGERLEELRRQDPGTPEHWSADEWEHFFSKPPAMRTQTHSWGTNGNGRSAQRHPTTEVRSRKPETEPLQTNSDGRQEILRLRSEQAEDGVRKPIETEVVSVPRPLSSVALSAFSLPQMPYKYKGLLKNHGMTPLRWRRGSMMLYLMAAHGFNAHLELDSYIAQKEGLGFRSNSTKKPIENLAAAGLLITETLRMETGDFRTALKLVRLSEEGQKLCQALGWPVAESDWHRLIRLHQGQRQPRHTLAVLYFAILARVRGWATEIVPEIDGHPAPDIRVSKDERRYYVEIELGTRGDEKQTAKWKNLADLQGKVAICAPNVKIRERLAKDCRLAKLSGQATDLATLVAKPYHEAQDEPLWLIEW